MMQAFHTTLSFTGCKAVYESVHKDTVARWEHLMNSQWTVDSKVKPRQSRCAVALE